MIWVWVLVTAYDSGEIAVAPGTNLGTWQSRAACEAALVAETDFGYTAGWKIRTTEAGTELFRELDSMRMVTRCFPVYAGGPARSR